MKNILLTNMFLLFYASIFLSGCGSDPGTNKNTGNGIKVEDGRLVYDYDDGGRYMLALKMLYDITGRYDIMMRRHREMVQEIVNGQRSGGSETNEWFMDDNRKLHEVTNYTRDWVVFQLVINEEDKEKIYEGYDAMADVHGSLRLVYMDDFSDLMVDQHQESEEQLRIKMEEVIDYAREKGYLE